MFSVLSNEKERTADRMEAAKWLADRGFGKAVLELLWGPSTEDLEAARAIYAK
jgi:hypothetical protein